MIETLDLFSGIGGFSLGLESTGHFRTVGFCEIESFPREVLRHHWPGVPIWNDVRELTAESLGGLRPDAIVGGFPCQDISVAGKGVGIEGARSGLWGEFARLVVELRPRWVLAENVGALRTRGIDRVCSDLEAEGYAVWPLVVGAWAVGAPHRRDRVWIVAQRTSGDGAEPSVPLLQGQREPRGGGGSHRTPEELAHRDSAGQGSQRPRWLLDGEREASGHDADGRGERPVGDTSGSGLAQRRGRPLGPGEEQSVLTGPGLSCQLSDPEGERRSEQGHGGDAGSRAGRDGPRWPARPGEPQHEWEEPRLAYRGKSDAAGRGSSRGRRSGAANAQGDGTGAGDIPGSPQLPVGGSVDGLPERLARRWNREALKALGNSVVPQVVAVIGQAIAEVDND